MLTCYLTRRRIDAYLDGALEGARAEATDAHLAACAACRQNAESHRRLRALLQQTLLPGSAVEPDWTGFWPGILRGIDEGRLRATPAPERRVRRFRWAFGGALAGALLGAVTLWQLVLAPETPEAAVVVSSADTEHPDGSVMVYASADRQMTVVWVFGLD